MNKMNNEYKRNVTWPDGHTIKFNDRYEVEGFTRVCDIWPTISTVQTNIQQRRELGGGHQCYRYHSTERHDWFLDFDAKAFWSCDNV